jgi:hypothetical protein
MPNDQISSEFHWVGDRIYTEAGIVAFTMFIVAGVFLLLFLLERRRNNRREEQLTVQCLSAIAGVTRSVDNLTAAIREVS